MKFRRRRRNDVEVVPAAELIGAPPPPEPPGAPGAGLIPAPPAPAGRGWDRSWNKVQLIFADGTVESILPEHELNRRMSDLADRILSGAS